MPDISVGESTNQKSKSATRTLTVTIRTRTPLWTGGVDGTMDRIHETGILGSLRWWYEVLVRGLGGYACDPTGENPNHRCQFDAKTYKKTGNIEDGLRNVCSVCRLFGCTGWKRRFELQTTAANLQPLHLATRDRPAKFNHRWLSEIFDEQSKVIFGRVTLRFRWMRGYENQQQIMQALLSLVSRLGGIGAKTQYGFGIFSYDGVQPIKQAMTTVKHSIINPDEPKNLSGEYPTLNNYWLLQCVVPNRDVSRHFSRVNIVGDQQAFEQTRDRLLPVSFDIRYKLPGTRDKGLRQAYRLRHGKMSTRQIFGTLKGDKRASNIFVSHLYKERVGEDDYQLRVWGFTSIGIADEIEQSLKDIFPNLHCNRITGHDLLDGIEV